jgi:hypothetical protein
MRKEYTLTKEQLATLLEACKPTPVMSLSGGRPMYNSPQENANRAWQKLGQEMGFASMTVKQGRDKWHFTAEEKPGADGH